MIHNDVLTHEERNRCDEDGIASAERVDGGATHNSTEDSKQWHQAANPGELKQSVHSNEIKIEIKNKVRR